MSDNVDSKSDSGDGICRQSSSNNSSSGRYRSFHDRLKIAGSNFDNERRSGAKLASRKRPWFNDCLRTIPEDDAPLPVPVHSTRQLTIGATLEVTQFYIQRFEDLQQSACKHIAKAFIKAMEPKKKAKFPYTGGNDRAPVWWPHNQAEKTTLERKDAGIENRIIFIKKVRLVHSS